MKTTVIAAIKELRGTNGLVRLLAHNYLRRLTSLNPIQVSEAAATRFPRMEFPPYDQALHGFLAKYADDYVRYGMIALAINSLQKENIAGSFAEVGVYRGNTSKMIHAFAPERKLYLFDTFEGFPVTDLEVDDDRFGDTNVETLKKTMGDLNNICIKKGYFPETAQGLENESFAFVMLDLDLYNPTLAGLQFFYPRMQPGGYIFAHDYNSPESNWAVSRAVNQFMRDKPEKIIEIPDKWGSILFRRI